MSTLHTVNKSPFEKSSLDSCLDHAREGSAVLMYEDGVYGALKGTSQEKRLQVAAQNIKLYALGPDLKARGIGEERLVDGITVIDYAKFVDLAAESDKVQAWV